jgi:hypothetical protein
LPAVAPGLLKLIEEAFVQQKNWVFIFEGLSRKSKEFLKRRQLKNNAHLDIGMSGLCSVTGEIDTLLLWLGQEESGLGYANSCGQLVKASKDQVSKLQFEELEFRSNAIAALCSLVCAQRGAG